MAEKLTGQDISFVTLPTAVFCVECELISKNNTPYCMACGSGALLSLSRVLGGSLRGQQTAHLIADAELDRLVRSLLYTVPQIAGAPENRDEHSIGEHYVGEHTIEPVAATPSIRHRMRPRHHGSARRRNLLIPLGLADLKLAIRRLAEK